ncbi:MAG: flavin reductase (DIM6/NTAB) family NADH-FMN oxidoreductase RutF [Sphingobacteriales bacterium]|jgi:flavin reductase (DIM6/NTAB) family NADH-FMN oxidoreductase RutF
MQYKCDSTDASVLYKLLTGTIIPRPIAWVSSRDKNGILNLAPFSFFNAVGEDPPHLVFSTVRTGNKNKDTLNNILDNHQFVVNLVTEDLVEKMNETATSVEPLINEFEMVGLTPVPSTCIDVPRVGESKVSFECELVHHYYLEGHKNGGACVMIGKILNMHVADEILDENHRINLEKYKPVARLAGANYASLGEIFRIKRK